MSAPSTDPVLLQFPSPGVALLRLNRPQATTALSLELQALLSRYFVALADNPHALLYGQRAYRRAVGIEPKG